MEPRRQATVIRTLLVGLALVGVALQVVVIPRTAFAVADRYPEAAGVAPLYIGLLVAGIFGFHLALLATLRLLSAATNGNLAASNGAFWSTALLAGLLFTAVMFAAASGHALLVAEIGGPPMLFGFLFSLALIPLSFFFRSVVVEHMTREIQGRTNQSQAIGVNG